MAFTETIPAVDPTSILAQGAPDYQSNFLLPPQFSRDWIYLYREEDLIPWMCGRNKYFKNLTYGRTYNIPMEVDVTWQPYKIGQTNWEGERLNPGNHPLTIDQQSEAKPILSDIDEELSPHALAEKFQATAQKSSREMLAVDFHAWCASDAVQAAVAAVNNAGLTVGAKSKNIEFLNTGSVKGFGTKANPIGINNANIIEAMGSVREAMKQNKAIGDAKSARSQVRGIIPSWVELKMGLSELRSASVTRDPESVMRSGYLYDMWGIQFASSVWSYGSGTQADPSLLIFANSDGFAHTVRMTKARKFVRENWEQALQMLLVWGRGYVKPEGIVFMWAYNVANPS